MQTRSFGWHSFVDFAIGPKLVGEVSSLWSRQTYIRHKSRSIPSFWDLSHCITCQGYMVYFSIEIKLFSGPIAWIFSNGVPASWSKSSEETLCKRPCFIVLGRMPSGSSSLYDSTFASFYECSRLLISHASFSFSNYLLFETISAC